MKFPFNIIQVILGLLTFSFLNHASAAIVQLNSPSDFSGAIAVIDFDGAADHAIANTLYSAQGVVFSRDDGLAVPLSDWLSLGRTTTSDPNVITTISGTFEGQIVPTFVTHLNAAFSSPVFEIGAFFGNDQGFGGYTETTLSIFDSDNIFLDSVTVPTNDNTSVDQFLGLRSDQSFSFARFDNNGTRLSVVLDDFTFTDISTVPLPSAIWMFIAGIISLVVTVNGRIRR